MRGRRLLVPILLVTALLACSCTEAERKGIERLQEVSNDVSGGMPGYYEPDFRDSDGDGVIDEVDRYPLNDESVYFPGDRKDQPNASQPATP